MAMKESEFQIELNELRARSKQQIHIGESEMIITPPAMFTDEMLEQIRVVVREEFCAMLVGDERCYINRRKLEMGIISLEEYQAEAKVILADISIGDTSTDEQEAFLKGQRKAV